MTWRSIKTDPPPKDGSVLLLFVADNFGGRLVLGSWKIDINRADEGEQWLSEDGDDWSCGYYFSPLKPTHWQPLPPPPGDER